MQNNRWLLLGNNNNMHAIAGGDEPKSGNAAFDSVFLVVATSRAQET
jgi:hypothetical protein